MPFGRFRHAFRVGVSATALAVFSQAVPAWAQEQTFTFDIPAQDLGSALRAFARASRQQVAFDDKAVQGQRAPALRGNHTAQQGLDLLLNGSGLFARRGRSGLFIVRPTGQGSAALSDTNLSDADGDRQGSDIVVTAQRRDEQLQKVPVAVTVLSTADLENQRVNTIQDVARVTPGLTMAAFSYQAPNISVRGANNSFSQIGVDRPVAIMLDDVFISRPSGAVFNLYDLASVQVLRGPQGTLFGRNVTGGAIVLTTRKPSFTKPEYSASVGYANYNQIEANGLVSVPVSDDVAVKVVASHMSHGGYGYDQVSQRKQDDLDSTSFRGQLRARSGDFETLFIADYARDDNNGRTLSSLAAGSTGNPRISVLGVDQRFRRRTGGISNTTTWTIPDDMGVVTATTAYRELKSRERLSTAGASFRFLTAGSQGINDDTAHVKDFSEEVRYTSPKWTWGDFIAGVYYLHNDAEQVLRVTSLAARTGIVSGNTTANQATTVNSISGYVDGNINLPGNFKLTLGGRYTHDVKKASVDFINALAPARNFSTGKLSRTFNQFTPRAVLSWNVDENTLVYANYSRGFTSGGFATTNTTLAAVAQGFQPEKVTNYEAGLKSAFFDRRVTLNVAAFKMDFKNKQEFVFNSLTGIGNITNAAQAKSKGVEVELGLHPINGLDINLNYGALRSRYQEFVVPGLLNYTGNSLAYSPRNKASATVHYEHLIEGFGYVSTNASYMWTGTYTISASTTQLAVQSFDLTNAGLAYETPDRRYRLAFWVKNLFDKDYELNATTTGTLAQWYGPPRTYGATASVKF
ncbi:TonB-dependent receptor domain-containing protein [Sphingomonas crocodyli]|uniref:TonB-dependent receptor n=1 Tax=Sphingomonas crocodyli TaxID=1979270 RepID=A0A437M7E5_9SPHN|nr:TonB-dependent receptor [Sphingomonas crocodyli]RVT93455.1 TonB-dependent receptor [Sphingomonas crocodyli]